MVSDLRQVLRHLSDCRVEWRRQRVGLEKCPLLAQVVSERVPGLNNWVRLDRGGVVATAECCASKKKLSVVAFRCIEPEYTVNVSDLSTTMPLQAGYSSKQASYFSGARAEMLVFVPSSAKTILEVGCGAGQFAAALKADRECHVTGIEPFAAAASVARNVVDRILDVDAERGIRLLGGQSFDCIVFNDVLEHLVDPWAVLRDVAGLLTAGGVLVASIPNVRYAPVLLRLVLKGEWEYEAEGVLDRTHLRFFTFKSVARMLPACGYSISHLEGINAGQSWKFALLRALTAGNRFDIHFPQIAVVARRAGGPEPLVPPI